MARIQKRVLVALPINVQTTLLTPPAGKKLEVLTVGFGNFNLAAAQIILYEVDPVAGNYFVAQQNLVAARFAETVNFTSVLIPNGSLFAALPLGAGAPAIGAHVTYMEVDL